MSLAMLFILSPFANLQQDAELERASTESKFQSALENMQAKDAAMTALKEKLREAREGSQDVIGKS